MGIDDDALVHIMGVLTDLYVDPELAIIREYATNAYDSHIEVGQTLPIEVDTPTSLKPYLSIRDYGVGLDADGIRQIYSRYGASTKRETNDAVGMLGLGCKSALAYVDQFTLVGTKDGIKTAVSVSRDEKGVGIMKILAEDEIDHSLLTDFHEPNGVEVLIPAKNGNDIERKARNFFSFWEKGTVLLNGQEPKRAEGLKLDEDGNYQIVKYGDLPGYDDDGYSYDRQTLCVVMGNVPYWVDGDRRLVGTSHFVLARVPIGTVQFAPSREALQETPFTQGALDTIRKDVARLKKASVAQSLAACKNRAEVATVALKLSEATRTPLSEIEYQGKPLPDTFSLQGRMVYGKRSYYRSRVSEEVSKVTFRDGLRSLWITGYGNKTLTSTNVEKSKAYCNEKGLDIENKHIIFVEEMPDSDWLADVETIGWTDIRGWRWTDGAARQMTASGNRRAVNADGDVCYDLIDVNGCTSQTPVSELSKLNRIAYLHSKESERYGNLSSVATRLGKDVALIKIDGVRLRKFRRTFPGAVEVRTILVEKAEEWRKNLTEEQHLGLSRIQYFNEWMIKLNAKSLDDPEFAEYVKTLQAADDSVRRAFRLHLNYLTDDNSGKKADDYDPFEKYPLLKSIRNNHTFAVKSATLKEVVVYLNASYAHQKKGKN